MTAVSVRTTLDPEEDKIAQQQRIDEMSHEISQHNGDSCKISENDQQSKKSSISTHGKSGYLFKWQDRAIGWSGTKWDLRFVRLERGRLSYYRSHEDSLPRYVLTLRNCAVRDDGYKPNKRFRKSNVNVTMQTPYAYFHIISIYQRPQEDNQQDADDDNEEEFIPLLRFSTGNYAEKMQWIELIAEACAYCDTEDFINDNNNGFKSVEVSYQNARRKPTIGNGTLPMMWFDSTNDLSERSIPSGVLKSKKSYLKNNSNDPNACKTNSQQKKDYPPSKPMHRCSAASYLSDEAATQNYRGLLNLGIIIFLVSNLRLLLDIVQEYGIVFTQGEGLYSHTFFLDIPLVSAGLVVVNICIYFAYLIELYSSRGELAYSTYLHIVNANLALLVPMCVVWYLIDSPVLGFVLLMCAVTTWMKLLSYTHVNADYRNYPNRGVRGIVHHLDYECEEIVYPKNITLSNIYFFCFAPTLTYQIAFPRSPRRSWFRILSLLVRLILSVVALVFILSQIISPTLDDLIKELGGYQYEYTIFSLDIMAKYLLKLTIYSTYAWLLVFYAYFHVFFNLLAEILRFGDRVFYKDWWNSADVSSYWRLWNLPVHYWLIRHLYFPSIRKGANKQFAMFIVFFFSAVVHEILMSIPFHMIRPWSFLGMMGQIPLIAITKYLSKTWPGSSIGNIIFWFSFCIIGQPTAILMYTIDHWKMATKDNFEPMDSSSLQFNMADEL